MFFGLEIEDLAAILSIACGILVLVSPLLAVPAGMGLFLTVRKLKDGKPPGYLSTLAYGLGLVSLARRLVNVPHLVPIPMFFSRDRRVRLSPRTAPCTPADRLIIRSFWRTGAAPAFEEACDGE